MVMEAIGNFDAVVTTLTTNSDAIPQIGQTGGVSIMLHSLLLSFSTNVF